MIIFLNYTACEMLILYHKYFYKEKSKRQINRFKQLNQFHGIPIIKAVTKAIKIWSQVSNENHLIFYEY